VGRVHVLTFYRYPLLSGRPVIYNGGIRRVTLVLEVFAKPWLPLVPPFSEFEGGPHGAPIFIDAGTWQFFHLSRRSADGGRGYLKSPA
jgi:hypothetical protein